jgi:hypothetical protein
MLIDLSKNNIFFHKDLIFGGGGGWGGRFSSLDGKIKFNVIHIKDFCEKKVSKLSNFI